MAAAWPTWPSLIRSAGISASDPIIASRRLRSPVKSGLLGEHMDHHHSRRRRGGGRAVRLPTTTHEPIGPGRHGPHRHRPGADYGCADRRRRPWGRRIQPRIDRVGIGGGRAGQISRSTMCRPQIDTSHLRAAPTSERRAPQHDRREPQLGLHSWPDTLRHCRPPRDRRGKPRIHRGHHLGIGDQISAISDRVEHAIGDVTSLE